MEAGATLVLPRASADTGRTLYAFRGNGVTLAGTKPGPRLAVRHGALVRADADVTIVAGAEPAELLMLQGTSDRDR